MTDSPRDEYTGRVILDAYYIDRLLATGSFSRVYHGRSRTGMEVAVKILTDTSPIVLHYYYREVKVLKALTETQNVVHYLNDDELDDGTPVLVTEFIDGVTLGHVLKSKPQFTLEMSVQFVIELCQAIEPLHMLGLVHRDLKPNNVMLLRDGRIKLIDFGLVRDAQGIFKLLEEEEPARRRAFAREIDTGVLAGTFPYMAPEQFSDALLEDMKAARTDTYTDVFSIGVILYEMLARQKPFQVSKSSNFLAIVKQRLRLGNNSIPPLHQVDAPLTSIIMKALDNEPQSRHPNARELREELQGFIECGSGANFVRGKQTIQIEAPTNIDQTLLPEATGASKRRHQRAASLLLESAGERTETWSTGLGDHKLAGDDSTTPYGARLRLKKQQERESVASSNETPRLFDDEPTIPDRIDQASTFLKSLNGPEDRPSSDDEDVTDKWRRDED